MVGCRLGGFGDDRHVQVPADYVSDVSKRHALFGDPVIPGSRREVCSIEPVHRAGPRLSPSPTNAEIPFSRARAII